MGWFRARRGTSWPSILGEESAGEAKDADPLAGIDARVLDELLQADPVLKVLGPGRDAISHAIGESYRRAWYPARTTKLAALSAAIWVGSAVLLQAAINVITNQGHWWALALLTLAALVGAGAYRLYRYQIRGATWAGVARLAELYLRNAMRLTRDLARAQAVVAARQQESLRMARALEHVNAALGFLGTAIEAKHERATAAAWRQSLLATLQFFSTIAQKEGLPEPRCGLIVRDPTAPDDLIPLLVYKPGEETYPSRSRFTMGEDFSGRLMQAFEANCEEEDFEEFLHDYIPDTDAHMKTEASPRFRVVKRHHRKIRSIFGIIVYKKDNGRRICQGALNLDSEHVDGLDVQRFRALGAAQRPMFRIINTILTLATQEPNLFNTIRTPSVDGRKGVADAVDC